jgi:hypothetical protein
VASSRTVGATSQGLPHQLCRATEARQIPNCDLDTILRLRAGAASIAAHEGGHCLDPDHLTELMRRSGAAKSPPPAAGGRRTRGTLGASRRKFSNLFPETTGRPLVSFFSSTTVLVMELVALTPQGIDSGRQPRCLPQVTHHAVDRYIDRVDPSATRHQAAAAIARIIGRGRVRSTPRHWMRGLVRQTPGLRFVYLAELPGVCALVIDGAVVTIITRRLCRRSWYPIIPGDVVEPIYCATDEATLFEYEEAA